MLGTNLLDLSGRAGSVRAIPDGSSSKESTCNVRDVGNMSSSPVWGRSLGGGNDNYFSILGEGNGNPLQYSCLENPMDGGAWWASPWVAKSQTRLSNFTFQCSCLENSMERGAWTHGQSYSPWGHKKLDMTEQLNTQAHWMGQAWPTRLRSVALGT